jgi:hypothetical protein
MSIAGATAFCVARADREVARPNDHPAFANLVPLAVSDAEERAEPRENEGAMVSAFAPAPVTSVAAPALTASDATDCAAHGIATNKERTDHPQYRNVAIRDHL